MTLASNLQFRLALCKDALRFRNDALKPPTVFASPPPPPRARAAHTPAGEMSQEQTSATANVEASKRLQKELMSLMMSNELDGLASAFPEEDNLFKWVGTLKGSDHTVYETLEFKITMSFPEDYPYTAPTIKFATP